MRPCLRPLMRYSVWYASASWNRLGRCDAAVTFSPVHLLVVEQTDGGNQHLLPQGLLQWLLQGPSQELSKPQLTRYLLDTCHWEASARTQAHVDPYNTCAVYSVAAGWRNLWLLTWAMRHSGAPGDPPRVCAVGRQGSQGKCREGRYGRRWAQGLLSWLHEGPIDLNSEIQSLVHRLVVSIRITPSACHAGACCHGAGQREA